MLLFNAFSDSSLLYLLPVSQYATYSFYLPYDVYICPYFPTLTCFHTIFTPFFSILFFSDLQVYTTILLAFLRVFTLSRGIMKLC